MWDTLAPELIFEIMQHFLPDMQLSADNFLFPWYLGGVCKAWRTVFITSPQFWSTLYFNLRCFYSRGIPSLRHCERIFKLTKIGLQRSEGHPISFRFDLGEISSNAPEAICCRQIFETVIAHSTRWRDAYFYLPVEALQTLYSVKNRLPILRSIQVVFIPSGIEFATTFSDLFTDAPQLTRVSIFRHMPWKINWSSVTLIHVDFVSYSQLVLPYLDQACRLEELVIKSELWSSISRNPIPPPITLASLKVLKLVTVQDLLWFETPALEELLIDNDSFPATAGISYATIVSRFFSPLRRLKRLTLSIDNTEHAEHFFQYMPIVQDISLRSGDPELLRTLSKCTNARHLEAVTFQLLIFKAWPSIKILRDLILPWRRHVSGGIGPFENLARISLWVIGDGYSDLEDHLIEQGVFTVMNNRVSIAGLPQFEDHSGLYT